VASSSKRERELARLRAQRQAARRAAQEAERAKRRNAVLAGLSAIAVAAVIVIIAVATNDGSKPTSVSSEPTSTPSTTATATAPPTAAPGTCLYTKSASPASKKVTGLPPTKPTNKGDVKVVMTTNRGAIGMTLHGAKAPCTTGSFTFLAGQKYFDGTQCHRLTTAGIFVLQCGDPSGSGAGGPGYQYADENLTGLGAPGADGSVTYPRGTVAMANAGAGTNGSQFFLVYKDSKLPPNYTPFGTITGGLGVLDTVAKAGSTPVGDGKPNLSVAITTFRVAS
jgi:peptidyl-prolyl cis-trans isomerase B (cyclophilin B)